MRDFLAGPRLRPAWVARHARTVGIIIAVAGLFNMALFLSLASSAGLGWWHPGWSAATGRVLDGVQVGLSLFFGLSYAMAVGIEPKASRRDAHGGLTLTRIGHWEALVLSGLAAAWGVTVLVGHPSRWLLFLIPVVIVASFFAMVAAAFRLRQRAAG